MRLQPGRDVGWGVQELELEDVGEMPLEERLHLRHRDVASRDAAERSHTVVRQAARDDAAEPREVGLAVEGEPVQRDASPHQANSDRADLVVADPHPGLYVRSTLARDADVRTHADHRFLQPPQVVDGVRSGSEPEDRIPDELARTVEREGTSAVDHANEPAACFDLVRRPQQLVGLRTTSCGEDGRVLEEDDRVRDLVGQSPLREPMHRRVRDVVGDAAGMDQPGGGQQAVKELERCYKKGARGVGELGDKGLGEFYSFPRRGLGLHIDDPRMKPLIKRCGELRMPISIHVAEDAWMYKDADSTNDGLMNAAKWKVDMTKPGILDHDQLVGTLENAVRENPKTTFIACHLANNCADLSVLGKLFDKYPNLYADIAARYGELAPIPRYVHGFMEKYSNRLVYGTDMGPDKEMYEITFRILESADEHFYERGQFDYHWPLYGLYLTDGTLKKLYSDNGKKILSR